MLNRAGILIVTLCAFGSTYGAEGRNAYYECPTEQAAYACDSSCKKTPITSEFKVNVPSNIVLMTIFSEGKRVSSLALENCKVVDEKNWICTTKMHQRRDMMHVMTNGKYSFNSFWPMEGISTGNGCAKKRDLFN
jgi:hypothetical protein